MGSSLPGGQISQGVCELLLNNGEVSFSSSLCSLKAGEASPIILPESYQNEGGVCTLNRETCPECCSESHSVLTIALGQVHTLSHTDGCQSLGAGLPALRSLPSASLLHPSFPKSRKFLNYQGCRPFPALTLLDQKKQPEVEDVKSHTFFVFFSKEMKDSLKRSGQASFGVPAGVCCSRRAQWRCSPNLRRLPVSGAE